MLLTPPFVANGSAPANGKPEWPDFTARLAKNYPAPVAVPTATELLAHHKEDRF